MKAAAPAARAEASRPGVTTIHASALIIGEAGVLVRGPSGCGKSALALALIVEARQRRLFARFIADDRVILRPVSGRLLMASHPAIAGRVERRFAGIHAIATEGEAVARLVVDLAPATSPDRLPALEDQTIALAGVALRRLSLPAHLPSATETILHVLTEIAV